MPIEDDDFDVLAGEDATEEDTADVQAELEADEDIGQPPEAEEEASEDVSEPTESSGGSEEAAEDQNQGGGQQVPLAVLLEERKTYQARLDALNEKAAKFDAFQERFERLQAEKDKEPEPEPDYLDDPKEYVDHQVRKAEQRAAEADSKVTEMRNLTEQQQHMQQINNRLNTYDAEFVKGNQDYYDAMDHIRSINIENAKAMGATPEQASTQAAQAMFMAQAQAMQRGINPSQYMYEMAKRFGYSVPAAEPAKPTEDKDDVIIAGQKAASMGGGAAPESERDEEMDDDEFSEAFSELFGQSPR